MCQSLMLGIAVLTLLRTVDAHAGGAGTDGFTPIDLSPLYMPPSKPAEWRPSQALSPSLFTVPEGYAQPVLPQTQNFSKDFRPHGRSVFDTDARLSVADEALISNTTVWQRLYEFRTRDRVQVLTLWKSGASTVSLQAGKKGDPSLQWTSRLMNRGGATRGLLDHLLPVSRFAEGTRGSRAASLPSSSKGSSALGALLRPTP